MRFDPFEYRVSRDIRNHLARRFLEALKTGNKEGFTTHALSLKKKAPDPAHVDFIHERTRRCNAVLDLLPPAPGPETDFQLAYLLFTHNLFYECHEWLENFWLDAQGPQKKAIQALIRVCGALVFHEAGRPGPAFSSAQKAIALIQEFRDHIPAPFQAEQLLKAMAVCAHL